MLRNHFLPALFAFFFLFALLYAYQAAAKPPASTAFQTIPSRTPTPGGGGDPATDTPQPAPTNTPQPAPTNTPDNNNGSGGPSSTNTPEPPPTAAATATNTAIPVTIASTPVGGILPTAEPCVDAPTISMFNTTNVRSGPGTDYEQIGQLVFREVRPLVGRAEFATWWVVELSTGEQGWVADGTGIVSGYIGNVPIVPAPPINGSNPTPGAPWNPTPRPSCTVTPTPTSTSTATPTATPLPPTNTATPLPPTETATVTPTIDNNPQTNNIETERETTTVTDTPAATASATATATLVPSPTTNLIAAIATTPAPTAVPLDEEPATSGSSIFLPVLGLLLVATGVFLSIARRRQDTV